MFILHINIRYITKYNENFKCLGIKQYTFKKHMAKIKNIERHI